MKTRSRFPGVALLSSALVVTACGTDQGPGGGTGGVGVPGGGGSSGSGNVSGGGVSGGGTAAKDCAHIDYASYAAAPPVSFRTDVLPQFGLSCVLSECHRPADHKAGLVLGYRCAYDASVKWTCRFPATPMFLMGSTTDIDVTKEQPQDSATTAMVRASLLAPSITVNGGGTARVVPMHPEASLLMQKLANTQSSQGYSCTNQDPRGSSMPPPCGVNMPLNGEPYCEGTARVRFDTIAAWIAQGALDN